VEEIHEKKKDVKSSDTRAYEQTKKLSLRLSTLKNH